MASHSSSLSTFPSRITCGFFSTNSSSTSRSGAAMRLLVISMNGMSRGDENALLACDVAAVPVVPPATRRRTASSMAARAVAMLYWPVRAMLLAISSGLQARPRLSMIHSRQTSGREANTF